MKIKALVMDVDGTMTNGKINIASTGELFKSFNVYDGLGISYILPRNNIVPIVITGRSSKIVEIRCKELGVKYFFQGISDKVECLSEIAGILNISFNEIGYIGDDLNDLTVMKICGVKACPANAVIEIKEICDYVCKRSGGHGAIREFIDWLNVKKFFYI